MRRKYRRKSINLKAKNGKILAARKAERKKWLKITKRNLKWYGGILFITELSSNKPENELKQAKTIPKLGKNATGLKNCFTTFWEDRKRDRKMQASRLPGLNKTTLISFFDLPYVKSRRTGECCNCNTVSNLEIINSLDAGRQNVFVCPKCHVIMRP